MRRALLTAAASGHGSCGDSLVPRHLRRRPCFDVTSLTSAVCTELEDPQKGEVAPRNEIDSCGERQRATRLVAVGGRRSAAPPERALVRVARRCAVRPHAVLSRGRGGSGGGGGSRGRRPAAARGGGAAGGGGGGGGRRGDGGQDRRRGRRQRDRGHD